MREHGVPCDVLAANIGRIDYGETLTGRFGDHRWL